MSVFGRTFPGFHRYIRFIVLLCQNTLCPNIFQGRESASYFYFIISIRDINVKTNTVCCHKIILAGAHPVTSRIPVFVRCEIPFPMASPFPAHKKNDIFLQKEVKRDNIAVAE